MEEPVTIVDRDVLKVLAVDTRMDILKELSEGNRTPSDLSKKLKKSGATIVEHLEALRKSGLVIKTEQPGKKWVFYSLTERGYGIIKSKSRKLIIILGTSMLSGVIGLGLFGKYFLEQGQLYVAEKVSAPALAENGAAAVTQTPWLLYFSVGFIAISLIGIGLYFIQSQKLKVA